MSVLYVILPVALVVVFIAVVAFVWAARKGQFDDLDTPAMRALHDDIGKQSSPPTSTDVSKEEADT